MKVVKNLEFKHRNANFFNNTNFGHKLVEVLNDAMNIQIIV